MRRTRTARRREPTIALINIIFLILIFFMVAGSLDTRPDASLETIATEGLDCCVPPGALTVSADGAIRYRGAPLGELGDYLATLDADDPTARVLPDRNLPALDLLSIVEELRAAGAERVVILTEQGSQ